MDVNVALGLLSALVVLTSQPYNTEGRTICGKDLRELQKRSSEDVVLLEGYEITPKDEERDNNCEKYDATSPFPTPAAQTTTNKEEPNMATPVPTPQKPSKNQLYCVYYGMLVKMYLPMRNLPTLPNLQGNKHVYTGRINGSANTRPWVVCCKLQRPMISVNKVLQDYTNARKHNLSVARPAMAIQASSSGSSYFYNLLRSFQRGSAVQRLGGRAVSSRCV